MVGAVGGDRQRFAVDALDPLGGGAAGQAFAQAVQEPPKFLVRVRRLRVDWLGTDRGGAGVPVARLRPRRRRVVDGGREEDADDAAGRMEHPPLGLGLLHGTDRPRQLGPMFAVHR